MCRCCLSYCFYNAERSVLFIYDTSKKMIEMPKLAELTDRIMALVSEEMEMPKEIILSKSRTAEAVDARHLAIKLLHTKDIYPKRIAEVFGMSPRTVHYIITSFDTRIQANKSLRNNFAKIAKQLGNNNETTWK